MQAYGIALLVGVLTLGLWAAVPVFGIIAGTGLGILFVGYALKTYQEEQLKDASEESKIEPEEPSIPPYRPKK